MLGKLTSYFHEEKVRKIYHELGAAIESGSGATVYSASLGSLAELKTNWKKELQELDGLSENKVSEKLQNLRSSSLSRSKEHQQIAKEVHEMLSKLLSQIDNKKED